jgi:valyl-tRNA synthetase
MAGYEYQKEPPFHHVYFTGIVRDKQGRKMSKSLGNSPDPIELIEKFGADGVRMGMMLSAPAGNDILFDESLCEQGRNFCNKIWNAFRLIKGWEVDESMQATEAQLLADEWYGQKQREVNNELNDLFSKYRISEALMAVYKLFWDEFSSWYLEMIKPEYGKPINKAVFDKAIEYLDNLLKMLHPFMPFITEEIWQNIAPRKEGESIMVTPFSLDSKYDADLCSTFERIKDVITSVRAVRAQKNIPMKTALSLNIIGENPMPKFDAVAIKLCNLSDIKTVAEKSSTDSSFLSGTTEYAVPLGNLIDKDAEIARMENELQHKEAFLQGVLKKLGNEKFVAHAPAAVIDMERKKQADAESIIKSLKENIASLK